MFLNDYNRIKSESKDLKVKIIDLALILDENNES